jgi:hypothetical protein
MNQIDISDRDIDGSGRNLFEQEAGGDRASVRPGQHADASAA